MFSSVRRAVYPGFVTAGIKKLPWTMINMRTSGPEVRDWVKDDHGMNMIYGQGWSAAFMCLSDDPAEPSAYVALTVSPPVHDPRTSLSSLGGPFIQAVLADPGLVDARCYLLYTAKRSILGRDRAVLIGDASHGMVPYCGAGASAGIKDAVDLVDTLCACSSFHCNYSLIKSR